jgi:hypothetical protein
LLIWTCVAPCDEFCILEKLYSHFALIHALSKRGRSLCMLWAPGSVWKVFKFVQAIFEQFGAGPVSWGGLTTPRRSVVVQAV